MVNKKFCLGILVIVLVFGMTVAGCSDDAQIVAFEYAEGTDYVEAVFFSGNTVVVYWNSVKNAVSYDVYGQMEPVDTTALGDPSIKHVPDIKYFSTIQADGVGITTRYMGAQIDLKAGGNWRFGVSVTDTDKNHVPSKITWSKYTNIPQAAPSPSP